LQQAELLGLYLTAGDNEVVVCLAPGDVSAQLPHEHIDAVLLAATFSETIDGAFAVFQEVQERLPGMPVVLGCRPTEMLVLPRFLNRGLRSYLIRDEAGDFVFLALACIESAVEAARADEMRRLTDRLREELDGVRRLQESIIPHGIKTPPGYAIAARYEPSQVTVLGQRPVVMAGGDYYDAFSPDDRTLVVLIGDASGHGLKSCMAIMAMHTLIHMFRGGSFRDTAAFVSEINQRLCENSIVQSDGAFITLFYAAIDTVEHTMHWTSAGHPLALLQRLAANEVTSIGSPADCGVPLGICADESYISRAQELPTGSRVLIYSDGLADAMTCSSGSQPFGVQGVVETLRAGVGDTLIGAVERLFCSSSDHTGSDGRFDDTSVVLLERLEPGAGLMHASPRASCE
jgi:serine phosphatase RsbU (regulator of sigma subunit)